MRRIIFPTLALAVQACAPPPLPPEDACGGNDAVIIHGAEEIDGAYYFSATSGTETTTLTSVMLRIGDDSYELTSDSAGAYATSINGDDLTASAYSMTATTACGETIVNGVIPTEEEVEETSSIRDVVAEVDQKSLTDIDALTVPLIVTVSAESDYDNDELEGVCFVNSNDAGAEESLDSFVLKHDDVGWTGNYAFNVGDNQGFDTDGDTLVDTGVYLIACLLTKTEDNVIGVASPVSVEIIEGVPTADCTMTNTQLTNNSDDGLSTLEVVCDSDIPMEATYTVTGPNDYNVGPNDLVETAELRYTGSLDLGGQAAGAYTMEIEGTYISGASLYEVVASTLEDRTAPTVSQDDVSTSVMGGSGTVYSLTITMSNVSDESGSVTDLLVTVTCDSGQIINSYLNDSGNGTWGSASLSVSKNEITDGEVCNGEGFPSDDAGNQGNVSFNVAFP